MARHYSIYEEYRQLLSGGAIAQPAWTLIELISRDRR